MRQSNIFIPTRRENPKDEESKNAIILMRGGYIDKTMAGVYTYLPLGLRVLRNVMAIVREEMDAVPGVQEILMPALQPRELWEESGRWEEAEDVMYRLADDSMGLGPTHEEIVTDIFRRYVGSYKELPLTVYQIQTKFRKEARAKSGLLRGREFYMNDLYSFHATEDELAAFHDVIRPVYMRIFERCGLVPVLTLASGGIFSKYSEEFQLINPAGEDDIYLNEAGDAARNKEMVPSENDAELLEFCGGTLKKASSIEVGNIFKLNRKFSAPMGASISLEDGTRTEVWTGSYGIGISRLVGTVVEHLGDVTGKMVWPNEIAPFSVHFIDLTPEGAGEKLYSRLLQSRVDVLYDDRQKTPGEKFADADLIGSPTRLILSKRSLSNGGVEVINMATGDSSVIPEDEAYAMLAASAHNA
jgi:prolyl-tRNA synthetase